MTTPSFIHLRVHSAYSLAEGAIKIVEDKPKDGALKAPRKDLIKLTLKHEMPAVALTDKGNLFGALEFAQACAEAGIQPIIGCQIAVLRPEQATLKTMARTAMTKSYCWRKMNRVIATCPRSGTISYVEKDRAYPFVTAEELAQHSDGLIALVGRHRRGSRAFVTGRADGCRRHGRKKIRQIIREPFLHRNHSSSRRHGRRPRSNASNTT